VDAEKKKWLRLGLLLGLIGGSLLAAHWTGLDESLDRERVRAMVEEAGAFGFLIFIAIFAFGELIHIPGLVFVAAGVMAFGQVMGGLLGYLGALVSVSTSFFVVRLVGGQPLAGLKRPRLERILSHLEERPIRVVTILRLILWMAPPINYALAMSRIRFRDYLIGSALGLLLPIAIAITFFEWLLR